MNKIVFNLILTLYVILSIVFINVLIKGNEPVVFTMNIIFLIASYGLFSILINDEQKEE